MNAGNIAAYALGLVLPGQTAFAAAYQTSPQTSLQRASADQVSVYQVRLGISSAIPQPFSMSLFGRSSAETIIVRSSFFPLAWYTFIDEHFFGLPSRGLFILFGYSFSLYLF
ncbi:hypothetical protein [Brevibacillus sp. H7]|uniref:hypothetical protein n=1 Tax=Brevibacillus sp. H7 TaxID=3349138 RepID=UPI0037F7DE17